MAKRSTNTRLPRYVKDVRGKHVVIRAGFVVQGVCVCVRMFACVCAGGFAGESRSRTERWQQGLCFAFICIYADP